MAAVPKNLTGSDQAVATTHNRVYGWTIRNTHATEALTVAIYNHASAASGNLLGAVALLAGTSDTAWFGPQGILADVGVYVDVSATGTASGSIYLG